MPARLIVSIETKNSQTEPNETKNRNLFINHFKCFKLQHKLVSTWIGLKIPVSAVRFCPSALIKGYQVINDNYYRIKINDFSPIKQRKILYQDLSASASVLSRCISSHFSKGFSCTNVSNKRFLATLFWLDIRTWVFGIWLGFDIWYSRKKAQKARR